MNIKKIINTITFKTFGYLVLFSTAILLMYWILQTLYVGYFYEKYQVEMMDKVNNAILKSEPGVLNEVFEKYLFESDMCVLVEYGEKVVEYNLNSVGCILGRESSRDYRNQLDKMNGVIAKISFVDKDKDIKSLMSRIERPESVVYVYTTLEDADNTSEILDSQIGYLVIFSIMLSGVIGFYLSKRITRPIIEVTNNAKDLANGKFNVKFLKSGVTEIDNLSDTLNYLGSEFGKTDEFRRDLMANVSHDLKTPLTMIKAYSEMVRDLSYKDDIKREEHLNIIMKETDRLNLLVNDILELSKLQAKTTVLNYEVFDLDKEVKSILKNYDIIKEKEGYDIRYSGCDKAIVYADKNKINQVVYNLVNNAINYTGNNKVVEVSLTFDGGKYLFRVIDSGKGIDDEDIEYIWDKYYKKEKNHKRNVIGTGLGLSICKNILMAHGFRYGVLSKKKCGSTFYFEISKYTK